MLGPRLLVVADTGPGLSLVPRICGYLEADLSYRPRTGGGSVLEVRFAQSSVG